MLVAAEVETTAGTVAFRRTDISQPADCQRLVNLGVEW